MSVDLNTIMTLVVGDIVEAPSLMGGMTPENVLLQVEAVTPTCVTFRATFFGVRISKVALTKNDKGAMTWTYNIA